MTWDWLTSRVMGTLRAVDEEGNVLVGPSAGIPAAGNAHYTISQRLAEMRDKGSKVGCYGCAALTWIANTVFRVAGDHCTNSMTKMPWKIPEGAA